MLDINFLNTNARYHEFFLTTGVNVMAADIIHFHLLCVFYPISRSNDIALFVIHLDEYFVDN